MHKDQTLLIGQIQVVRDGSVRLGVGPVVLVRGKMSKDDGGGVDVVSLRRVYIRRWRRCRRVECPL